MATSAAATSASVTSHRCRSVRFSRVSRRPQRYAPNVPPFPAEVAEFVDLGLPGSRAGAGGRRGQPERLQGRSCDGPDLLAIHLDPAIERAHGLLPQTPAEEREHRDHVIARRCPRPEQCGRLVGRKEATVILEDDEVVALEQAIRGEAVDDVDGASRERLVLEGRKERSDCARPQAASIDPLQSREPILPLDEVGSEASGQVRTLARGSLSVRSPYRLATSGRTAMA